MRIGYPCINLSLDCKSSQTFRLKNYSTDKLKSVITSNLNCLLKILEYNKKHNFYLFRITSNLIPFASHSIMKFDWQNYFKEKFEEIGDYVRANNMRISMHPGQYTLINSKDNKIVERSVSELIYHVDVLDLMEMNEVAKVQIHIGGVYHEKESSMNRFIENYNKLNLSIKNRLVIENDDKNYTLKDCLQISKKINIPIVFDVYHHESLNSGESILDAFKKFTNTWKEKDGIPIVDYSSEHPNKKKYSHADQINIAHFKTFLNHTKEFDYDLMLEIKDKERSALRALEIVAKDPRLNKIN